MRRLTPIALALVMALPRPATAELALPPRSVADVVTLVKSANAVSEQFVKAKTTLNTPLPAAISDDERVRLLTERSRAASLLGLNDQYLADIRAAWEASGKSMAQKYVQTRVEYLAAEAHSGNLLAALELTEAHAKAADAAGPRLASLAFLVENLSRHGDIAGAEKHMKQAEVDFSLLYTNPRGSWGLWGDAWQANIERARAGLALGRGKYDEAERHFRQAAEFRAKDLETNRRRLSAGLETNTQEIAIGFYLIARRGQADMLIQMGRLTEAEALYRDILYRTAKEFSPSHPFFHKYTEGLVNVLTQQGRLSDARKLAEASLAQQEAQGFLPESRVLTTTRYRLASIHVAQRNWPAAHAQYQAIEQAFAKDDNLRAKLGKGDKDWALTLMRIGQPAVAEAMMSNLLIEDSKRFGDDDHELAETRGLYGMALAGNGKTDLAIAEFRKAIPTLLQAQKDASEEESGTVSRRLTVILEAYLELLHAFHARGQQLSNLDIPGETFRIADVARGSSVQKALLASAARSSSRDPRLGQLARAEQDLSHRINTLNDTLSRLLSAPPAQRLDKIIGDIRKDIPELKAQRKQLRTQIDKDFPDYANLISPQPLRPDEAQRLLLPGEALLTTYVGEMRSYSWAIAPTGGVQFASTPVGHDAILRQVSAIRSGLDLSHGSALDGDLDLQGAHTLYAQFIAPVSAQLGNTEHLLIVPHGPLGQIPFALLPTRPSTLGRSQLPFDAYAKVPWLIQERAITQLPSVSTLQALRQFAPQRTGQRQPLLGFGDPLFNTKQASEAAAERPLQLASRSVRLRASLNTRNASSATIADLARLPDTATELNEIASALKSDPAQAIHLGKAATESSVKGSALDNYRIVAFATHGLIPGDLNGLAQPALALSNPEVTGEKDADGLLTMEEILGLKLNADWVVLSACNTASADGSSAEAVSGLGRAFFYAGTRALLVTNWPVETVSARLLTTELFRKQAEQSSLSRAQALRSAMLTVMQGKSIDPATGKPEYSYAHPLFWAPYSLVGDGGTK